jgi:hypothetical protein
MLSSMAAVVLMNNIIYRHMKSFMLIGLSHKVVICYLLLLFGKFLQFEPFNESRIFQCH